MDKQPEKPLPCPRITRGQKHLTEEQEAYARRLVQERVDYMLSTEAINEEEAEDHVGQAYRVAGLEPVPIRWFDSPLAFVQAHVQVGHPAWDEVWYQVWNQLWGQPYTKLWDQIGDQVGTQIRDQVWRQVGTQGMTQVGTRIWGHIQIQVSTQFGGQFGDQIWRQAMSSIQSYTDEPYQSFSHFFHEIFEPNDLIHLALFNPMVSGFNLGSKEAWLVRKPIRMERDEQGRLHSDDGMCMQYRDGWGFYA